MAGTIALLIFGLLILVPSGLCTGAMLNAGDHSMVFMVLVIGGPFVLGGGAMVWAAIKRLRRR